MTDLTQATLTVTGNELQQLYHILDEVPGKIGRPLFQKFQQQVQAQIEAHERKQREDAEKAAAELREKHRKEFLEEGKPT